MSAEIKLHIPDSDDADAADLELSNRTPLLDKSWVDTETKTKVQKLQGLFEPDSLESLQVLQSPVTKGIREKFNGSLDTRLHEAVRLHDMEQLRCLLDAGAAVATLDEAGRTPAHLCVELKMIQPFKKLLETRGTVEVLDGQGISVLFGTVLAEWPEGVEAALDAGADLTAICNSGCPVQSPPRLTVYNLYGQTALHLAAMSTNMEMLDVILGFAKRKGALDCLNAYSVTPLYFAIEMKNLVGVKAFLNKGASAQGISKKNETVLHVAVKSPTILKYILENVDVAMSLDSTGSSPIHKALCNKKLESLEKLIDFEPQHGALNTAEKKSPLHLAAESGCYHTTKYVISKINHVFEDTRGEPDINGDTPLFLALGGRHKEVVELLLQEGDVLSAKGKDENIALEKIATEFNDASDIFSNVLDHYINIKSDENQIDYSVFTDNRTMSQISVIEKFIEYDHSDLLLHPLIHSFVYIKWRCFVPLFYATIGVHATLLISFNILVANVFYHRDMANSNDSDYESVGSGERWFRLYDGWFWFLIVLIYTIIAILTVQMIVLVYIKRIYYFADLETWVRLCFLVLAGFVPVVLACAEPATWQRHVTCVALLLGWLQAMFLLSRFPTWGSYVLMFGRVAFNLIKILVSMLFLIIGFSLCFMIQYRSRPPFDGPYTALVKTLIMMSSELGYGELFGEHHRNAIRDSIIIIRLLFVLFVVFVAIALMNFMTGAAVSDINKLKAIAKVRRLEKQVQLLSTLETLLYVGVLAKYLKKLLSPGKFYAKMTFPISRVTKWKVDCYAAEKWSGSNSTDERRTIEVQPCPELHKDIVKLAEAKKLREEKHMTDNKVKMLLNTLIEGPKEEGDVNTVWVRVMMSKLNEQVQCLEDKVSLLTDQVKSCNENFCCKIGHVLLNLEILKKKLLKTGQEHV